ncbi:bifunctional glutamate/proline--tRNA ligase-like [Watersipora subatra]|uniref:bifunctional glutamate/proline--tRNA ligase-like n=1 Tax=Watersipora subatra TaxID=2589382 RepID=UPI00355B4F94
MGTMEIECSSALPPAVSLLTAEFLGCNLNISWGSETKLGVGNDFFTSDGCIARYLLRIHPSRKLYGTDDLSATEVDHWLDFASLKLACDTEQVAAVEYLEKALATSTYLVGEALTLADLAVWAGLRSFLDSDKYVNVKRYMGHLTAMPEFQKVSAALPKQPASASAKKPAAVNKAASAKGKKKDEGKFIELEGAKQGEVVVRFPPEASGYLHIGHAKAALLNQYYQLNYGGKLIMRFDDTNPAKEKTDFEKIILEDVKLLGITYDIFSHTSDHFELMLSMCEGLIKEGHAFVDDTDGDTMKQQRSERINSRNRDNDVAKNLSKWEEMKAGTDYGQTCCVRAKIDMASDNGCMRDPTLYRCKPEPHPHTGTKYKVYPTYDFACPIVDSVEGVTHALRTTEYHDRDDQYNWFIEKLRLRPVHVWEYSRLNLQHTVLSKRKLTWFVNEGHVTGWDDPRFPTVRGVLRRGMTVEGLKQFIIAQGGSRSVVTMEWDKIWSFNRKVIDPVVPRYFAILKEEMVPVYIDGTPESSAKIPKHPRNEAAGEKTVYYSSKVYIEGADAAELKLGEMVTFINWGNITITGIELHPSSQKIKNLQAKLNLDNKDFKQTMKITWLADHSQAAHVDVQCIHYGDLITKPVLAPEDDFKDFVNPNSKTVYNMLGDPGLAELKKGDIIQLQRRGYYICDKPAGALSVHTGTHSPCVLINIPDGHQKEQPTSGSKKEASSANKSVGREKKAKVQAVSGDSKETKTCQTAAALELYEKITAQGNVVRELKARKAAKAEVDHALSLLLSLKADYKNKTGSDWVPPKAPVASSVAQGSSVKQKKSKKASQADIEQKSVTAKDQSSELISTQSTSDLNEMIANQGQIVRELKAQKASKDVVKPEVDKLLALKEKFKSQTGENWVAGMATVQNGVNNSADVCNGNTAADIEKKIVEQGNAVRKMKAEKVDAAVITDGVKVLKELKAEYKKATGKDWMPQSAATNVKKEKQHSTQAKKEVKEAKSTASSDMKKMTRLGMEASKDENLSEWYSQVITKSEMIEYHDVSGCYILRAWSYSVWEKITAFFDSEIKKLGVENCYFPIFVSQAALEKEKEHIADFAPEVAWVTKSGQSELAEPIAIRPTSETVMYPAYAKWIQSHRDLPLKLNQWNNVVRWEFKHPQPFLRTREFLWQEGHSAFAEKEEAMEEVRTILELYASVYEEYLAIPVVRGRKTEKEKFAGGDYTYTVEAFISASGRAIQGATSHHLGQNFSKMFNIVYEHPQTQQPEFVYQNSWGITTRTIGVLVMVHGDNKGLVLPPKVAGVQVVVIPCGLTSSLSDAERNAVMDDCKALERTLVGEGIRAKADLRDNYSPGWKFNHWELKGVPIRIELGPRDIKQGTFVIARRDTGDRVDFQRSEVVQKCEEMLDIIQKNLYNKAKADLDSHIVKADKWEELCAGLDNKCLLLSPFCGEISCEDAIKKDSAREIVVEEGAPAMGAKGLCIPFEQPAEITSGMACVFPNCKRAPRYYTLFGRSY